jgi:hypothetical protein
MRAMTFLKILPCLRCSVEILRMTRQFGASRLMEWFGHSNVALSTSLNYPRELLWSYRGLLWETLAGFPEAINNYG